jgi:prolipoprotein diacylglyceryltransferase
MYSHFDNDLWVTPFGLVFLSAILAAWLYARYNATASGIDGSHVDLLIPVTVIVGVAGGTVIAILMPMDHLVAGEAMNHGIRVRLFVCSACWPAAVWLCMSTVA